MPEINHPIAGRVRYRVVSSEEIVFYDNWPARNLATVYVPQLKNRITFFKKAIPQMLACFQEIEAKGLARLIVSYDGAFNPRPIRGSTKISNHALGLAIDINAGYNKMYEEPATEHGTVLKLVPIFKKWGFGWGGDYRRRSDPMHFEVLKIVPVGAGATQTVKPTPAAPTPAAPAPEPTDRFKHYPVHINGAATDIDAILVDTGEFGKIYLEGRKIVQRSGGSIVLDGELKVVEISVPPKQTDS
jgi:hypothetical protein